jgi:hypothetical protein
VIVRRLCNLQPCCPFWWPSWRLHQPSSAFTIFAGAEQTKSARMSTIAVVPLSGVSAKLVVHTREHCPPHATCREIAGHWVVRIWFSFSRPTAIGLYSIIPSKNHPGSRVVNELVAAVRQHLPECRRLWWTYQQNNPRTQVQGACCLNNSLYQSWTVRDATYDPGTCQTTLRFTNGQTLDVQM